jgi:FtsZ-binding cell division protein ZapB
LAAEAVSDAVDACNLLTRAQVAELKEEIRGLRNDTLVLESQRDALAEALLELAELMDDIRAGTYEPDSFTTQPARAALAGVNHG